jgi:hypothetical protein
VRATPCKKQGDIIHDLGMVARMRSKRSLINWHALSYLMKGKMQENKWKE